MKKLLILGLLVVGLSSCGQSLDSTSHTNDSGEDVTTETNHNRLEDIQDCLNGDREACQRAVSEGFTNAPLFINDLAEKNELVVENEDGVVRSYIFFAAQDDRVIFRNTKQINNYDGGERHYTIVTDIQIHADYSVDIVPKYRWSQNGYTSGYTLWYTSNSIFNNVFHLLGDSNLEWKSHDSQSMHIERIGNIDVN